MLSPFQMIYGQIKSSDFLNIVWEKTNIFGFHFSPILIFPSVAKYKPVQAAYTLVDFISEWTRPMFSNLLTWMENVQFSGDDSVVDTENLTLIRKCCVPLARPAAPEPCAVGWHQVMVMARHIPNYSAEKLEGERLDWDLKTVVSFDLYSHPCFHFLGKWHLEACFLRGLTSIYIFGNRSAGG